VPLEMAKKHISEQSVISEAVDKACKKAHKDIVITDIIQKHDDIFTDSLSYGVDKIEKDQLILTCEFNLYPQVTLPNYKKTNIKFKKSNVTKEDIAKYVDELVKKDTLLVPKEGDIIANGDTVIFDFKGFIDGQPFEGGEAKLFELEIGSNQFIPGFEKQMIGLKRDEQKTIKVDFPENYHEPKFAGKTANFELNIRDIKITKKPTIDDEYIKSLNIANVTNMKDFDNYVTKLIESEQLIINRQVNMKLIYEFIKKESKLSYIPQFLVEKEKHNLRNALSQEATKNNLDFEQYMNENFKTKSKSDIEIKIDKLAQENIVLILSLSEIMRELNIKLSEQDKEEYYVDISKIYNVSVDEIKKMLGDRQDISEVILQNKIVDEIVKLNN
jgi:trigger factor